MRFWTTAVLAGLVAQAMAFAPSAFAHVTYNIAGYGSGLAGSTNGADGLPPTPDGGVWTNGSVADYAGALPVMWYAGMHDATAVRIVQSGAAPAAAGSLLAQVETYNEGADPDLPTDRVLAVGGKSWADPENEGQGWGHGLDYGLLDLADLLDDGPITFTVTLADDPADAASVQLAFAIYGGWDASGTSSRHQTFVTSPAPVSNPLGSAGLTLIDYAVAASAGETLTRTYQLTNTHDGEYTIFVAALGGVSGQYRLTITPEAAPPGDADGDGIGDDTDNCVATANADQLDADADGLGDACDAFPNDPNNQFAQCSVELAAMASELAAATADADGDGRHDDQDACAGTPSGAAADTGGCSQAQFCASVDVGTKAGQKACKKADWRNDEPLMRKKADLDCTYSKSARACQPPL